MSDSREDLAKLVASRRGPTAHTNHADREVADRIIKAGWVRVKPADPAVIDRVAEVHRVHANLRGGRVMHCRCGEASPDQYGATRWHSGHVARAVLAALGGDRDE